MPKCPTCGSEVEIVSTDEGTGSFRPVRYGPCETCKLLVQETAHQILPLDRGYCQHWYLIMRRIDLRGCGWYEPHGEEARP